MRIRRCRLLLLTIIMLSLLVVYICVHYLMLPNIHSVNRYVSISIRPGFNIKPPFSFPEPNGIKPVEDVVHMRWLLELVDILADRTSKRIYLLTCDMKHYGSLLNWLVAAYVNTEIELSDILVISLDKTLYEILKSREISTIYVEMRDVIRHYSIQYWTRHGDTWDVVMTRMAIVRLILHFGFDVVVFDVDAIPLRDPHTLFSSFRNSDIISAHALEDHAQSYKWSLCFGFVLFKSTPRVEYLWEFSSNITEGKWNDINKLNWAITVGLHGTWSMEKRRTNKCKNYAMSRLCDITGVTKTGLRVTLLSRWAVCRHCGMTKFDEYYVWYKIKRTSEDKDKMTELARSVWFLRDDWKKADRLSTAAGPSWIHEISDG